MIFHGGCYPQRLKYHVLKVVVGALDKAFEIEKEKNSSIDKACKEIQKFVGDIRKENTNETNI